MFTGKYEVNRGKSSHLLFKCPNCMTKKELVERTLSSFGRC
nr:ORF4 [Methanosarcina spherical virus]